MAAPLRSGRPSPADRRRRRTRTLALVVAIALVATLAVPLVTLAAPPAATATLAVVPAEGGEDARTVLGTQDVHEVWLWSTAFLRGDAAALAAPLDGADQWVAGTASGTRTAWLDPEQDSVVLAASDDDVELAGALATLGAGDRLVTDEGDWLVLAADGTVRALLPDRPGQGPPSPTTLADFQTTRSARWAAVLAAADVAGEDMAGGGGGAGSPGDAAAGPGALRSAVPWAVLAAMALTGTAVAVRTRRERDRRVPDPQAAVGSTSPRSS
jgi:hypothetical protein